MATLKSTETPWGPTGEVVYDRTYSRTKPDGTKETWPETCLRVIRGNLSLVYGDMSTWSEDVLNEADDLYRFMKDFAIIPAGRQLWASGVPGRQFLFNCHHSGWGETLAEHFEFTFLRLMEGGGVGSNYSMKYIGRYGAPRRAIEIHLISDRNHPDYEEMWPYLSREYSSVYEWDYSGHTPVLKGTRSRNLNIDAPGDDFLVSDSREGWADAMSWIMNLAMSDMYDNDPMVVVLDLGGIRQSGALLKSFGGTASGPAPFARLLVNTVSVLNRAYAAKILTPLDAMEIDHGISECVVSGNTRRSARMSMLSWDDPYIMDFLRCKEDSGNHWSTNISVVIDDEFIRLLNQEASPTDCQDMRAFIVHSEVCERMLKNGEPGYWNYSLSNVGEVGEVTCTNPCGEIPLEMWEACNLGSINMDYFAPKRGGLVDLESLHEAHRLMTRFLIRSTFGDIDDPKQKKVYEKNRRIGVGHFGVQGFWAKQGIPYSLVPQLDEAHHLLESLYTTVREEARDYAFALRITEPVKVTDVAPTGSTAKMPGATEGIHALHSRWYERRIRFNKRDTDQFNKVMEYMAQGFEVEDDVYDQSGMTAVVVFPTEDILVQQVRDLGFDPAIVESSDEIPLRAMLEFQAMYQEAYADNAVSFTVNVLEGALTPRELADTLKEFLPRLKGTTLMVDASRPQSPYTRITQADYEAAIAKTIADSIDLECKTGACPVK